MAPRSPFDSSRHAWGVSNSIVTLDSISSCCPSPQETLPEIPVIVARMVPLGIVGVGVASSVLVGFELVFVVDWEAVELLVLVEFEELDGVEFEELDGVGFELLDGVCCEFEAVF